MEYYQLQVKNEPFQKEYDAIDADDTIARQQYLNTYPEFRETFKE